MATILNNKKSSGGSPYAYYTVTANASNRTISGVTVSGTVTSKLASSSSSLGTGATMGLNAYITLNGVEYGPIELKSTSTSWSGTTKHDKNYSYTIPINDVLQTSIPVKFRVSRTGSAEGNYTKGAALSSTSCSNVTFDHAQAQSVFNSVTFDKTDTAFTFSATQYGLYDVLEIKYDSTVIKTINGAVSGTQYTFDSTEQTTLNNLFGASDTTKTLTATLTTYVSNGGTNLGSTDKTGDIKLPDYTPIITFESNTATDDYSAYKNNDSDVIKGISTVGITTTMSSNYDNTYASATCNGTVGSINGTTITFSNLTQKDSYLITVTDSRGVVSTLTIDGSSYNSTIKTVQYTIGNVLAEVVRESPTSDEATVEVSIDYYDGTDLKTSALLTPNYVFKYTESGGSEVTVNASSFSNNKYTITGLDYTKSISWSVTGTDKIGRALNSDSGIVSVGLPAWNVYNKDNINKMHINGDLIVDNAIYINGVKTLTYDVVDEW